MRRGAGVHIKSARSSNPAAAKRTNLSARSFVLFRRFQPSCLSHGVLVVFDHSYVSVTTVAAASNPAGGTAVPGSSAGQADLASRVLQIMMQSARRLGEPSTTTVSAAAPVAAAPTAPAGELLTASVAGCYAMGVLAAGVPQQLRRGGLGLKV